MSRILQCPIDNNKPTVNEVKYEGTTVHYYLYCQDCGLPGLIASTKKQAIGNWNKMVRERSVEYERQKSKIRRMYRS